MTPATDTLYFARIAARKPAGFVVICAIYQLSPFCRSFLRELELYSDPRLVFKPFFGYRYIARICKNKHYMASQHMKKLVRQDEYIKAYDEFSDAIFRYCYLKVSNREKAKDIMQDTFIKVWEYINKDDAPAISNIRAFLYKTAGNLVIDEYRKKKALSLDELQEGGFDAGSEGHKDIQNSAELSRAMEFVGKLDDKYRDVIIMRFVNGLSPREIGETLGETENNISVRINRAVKKVKELLEHGE